MKHLERCGAFRRLCGSSSSSSSSKFYDSQSGLYITKPGSRPVRVHDYTFVDKISFTDTDKDLIHKVIKQTPSSIVLSTYAKLGSSSYPTWLWEVLQKKQRFVSPVRSYDQICEVCKQDMFEGVSISVQSTASMREAKLLQGIRFAVNEGLSVQCLLDCDLSGGLSCQSLQISDEIAILADAGADCILLTPSSNGNVDEDYLREVIESAFNLDVAGDPIRERLGVTGPRPVVKMALAIGCTHTRAFTAAATASGDNKGNALKCPSIEEIKRITDYS